MAVRINDISGNVDVCYTALSIDDCKGDTDREVFKLVEETGDVITMGKVIGYVPNAATLAADLARQEQTQKRTVTLTMDVPTTGDENPVDDDMWESRIDATVSVGSWIPADFQPGTQIVRPTSSRSNRTPEQSELLDIVHALNKVAEIANGLVSTYQDYESYTSDADGDETDTVVWEKAQAMIDLLQNIGGFNENADELEDAQREIDEETQS